MIFHDASLEMENQWVMEFCEAPTLESDEEDSTDEHLSMLTRVTIILLIFLTRLPLMGCPLMS